MAVQTDAKRALLPAKTYARAERLLPDNLKDRAFGLRVQPAWISGTERFWFQNRIRTGSEIVLVDAAVGTCEVLSEPPEAPPEPSAPGELPSPDGHWAMRVHAGNLVVRDTGTGRERQITEDGGPDNAYATPPDPTKATLLLEPFGFTPPPLGLWSPDSTRFVTHRIDGRAVPHMHLVQSVPRDGGRPRLHSWRYPMPGDPVFSAEFVVLEVASGAITRVQLEPVEIPFMSPFFSGQIWWDRDGRCIYYLRSDRRGAELWLERLDPDTGEARTLVHEQSDDYINTIPNLKVLGDGAEVIWWSERDGWGHLYLIDGRSGDVIRQLTSGSWLVRDLVHVDEEERVVYFTAAGREPGSDPYVRQLYRVRLDTGEIERLTDDELDHEVSVSPSGRSFLDLASRWDTPPVTSVRDRTGAAVVEVQRADVELLVEAGWRPPERFRVKAADGKTDIYGLLYRPLELDPDGSYPILDDVYPGPQAHRAWPHFQGIWMFTDEFSFVALGFAVVTIDGRGTALRSREFTRYSYGRLEVAGGLEDHIAAIRQLAERFPWLDADRVGVYGHSAGGYAAARAILGYPEFYKVAVSSAGDHDPRFDSASWIEKYEGPPDKERYAAAANTTVAGNLQGKLLLIQGDSDEVVTPDATMRLAQALIKANKDFDLLMIPNMDHWLVESKAYWLRRRWDYFVEHLLGVEPPRGYQIKDIPIDSSMLAWMFGG